MTGRRRPPPPPSDPSAVARRVSSVARHSRLRGNPLQGLRRLSAISLCDIHRCWGQRSRGFIGLFSALLQNAEDVRRGGSAPKCGATPGGSVFSKPRKRQVPLVPKEGAEYQRFTAGRLCCTSTRNRRQTLVPATPSLSAATAPSRAPVTARNAALGGGAAGGGQ